MLAPSDAVRSPTMTRSCAIKCNALNLSRYRKKGNRRKPALSRLPCTGTGLSASYGSLSRASAMAHSAVRGDIAGLFIGKLQWSCTPFFRELWDQEFLP